MKSTDWLSVFAAHVLPPLLVCHTPPPAAAIQSVVAFVGWGAIPTVRPAKLMPAKSGPGPNGLQTLTLSGTLLGAGDGRGTGSCRCSVRGVTRMREGCGLPPEPFCCCGTAGNGVAAKMNSTSA